MSRYGSSPQGLERDAAQLLRLVLQVRMFVWPLCFGEI